MGDLEFELRIHAAVATGFGMGEHGCPKWSRAGRSLRAAHRRVLRARKIVAALSNKQVQHV